MIFVFFIERSGLGKVLREKTKDGSHYIFSKKRNNILGIYVLLCGGSGNGNNFVYRYTGADDFVY